MKQRRHGRSFFFLVLLIVWLIGIPQPIPAQQKKKLTYEQAFGFGGMRLLGRMPSIRGWADDQHYLESRVDETDGKRKLFKVEARTGKAEVYFDASQFAADLPQGFVLQGAVDQTDDYTRFIFNRQNDLYYFNAKTRQFRRLTANPSQERNPTLSPDGRFVAYTRDHNLFAYDLDNAIEYQLTTDGSETVYNGWASWVYYEEILGRSSRYRAFYWSPDGKKLAFLRFDDSPVPTFPLFRADGTHGELEIERYPKAGDPNPYVKLGVVPATGGEIVWADFDEKADEYVAWIFWTPDGQTLTCQWMNRDQNHLKIFAIDPATGKKKQIYEERQDAWIDFFEDLHFLKDGSGFLVHSDVDGWPHLYLYNMDGSLRKRLTKGEWRVIRLVLVDETNQVVYFTGDKDESTETHLFRVNFSGKGFKKLTSISGTHQVQVSPQGSYFIDRYSNITTPGKLALYDKEGKLVRQLSGEGASPLDEYDLATVELFRIPTEDGLQLPAVWFKPPQFDPNKKYPVIFSIYGGPNSQGVRNSFPFRLSSFYLAQEGSIVITVDHRGSGHFGKKGLAQMHRNLGKWEMHDWIEAVKWLRKQPFVDPSRIGITGGSYGGYATLMALTYGYEYFTHGISLYPVTDWKLYDTVYTERYMDRPQDNPEGYEFGSVLTHARNLKGKLLLVHGTMDDNVHMQNTIQLVDLFTQMNKQFQLMIYPNERHGVGGRRAHLNQMIFEFWKDNGFIRGEE